MKCDIRCFAFPDCNIMDRIAILLVLLTEVSTVLSRHGYNVSQSSIYRPLNGPHMAVDDDQNTCAVTEKGLNEHWRIQFNQTLTVKGMLLRLKGGNYCVEVRNSSNELADRQICDSIHLQFDSTAYSVNISCKPAVPMDVIMINRTNYGSLVLCDFQLRETCQSNCKNCTPSCIECDRRSGKCTDLMVNRENCTAPPCGHNHQSATGMEFWILFSIGVLVLIASPFLIKRFHKRFRWRLTLESSPSNLYGQNDRARFNLNSSRVILEPEGDSHNLNDPYSGVIQVVVTFNNVGEKKLPIEQFVKETHQKMMKNEFYSEFRGLPNGPMNLHTAALRPENSTKNRYKKIYPYDDNRVILDPPQDYINASYIQGVYNNDAYIAAQGPFTSQTVIDFWRMVWQENSKRIVMLTRLREDNMEKCQQYWPNDAGEIGPFHIIIQKEEILDQFAIRKFIVRKGDETRRINHYQFTGWPDTKSPQSVEGLLCFRNLTKNSLRSDEGPMIVHGSAGIGRTGTFIALDYLLEKGFKEGCVDVKGCVINLRQQRPFSIQSVDQYVFLLDALVEGLTNIGWNCALHELDEI
ncbi:tyrosine-protein phosphatase Lar-like isoform X2 [Crassostrea virginica]